MALSEHDHDVTRRYLLGQLTDDEEQKLEERLLSEDDFFQEVELTKDELAQEYASGELSGKERQWLQENFLASPEGKQRHEFAKIFDQYVRNHRAQPPKRLSLMERLRNLWNTQPQLISAVSTAAVLVIAVGIYWLIPTSTPRSVAQLTVQNNQGTRSTDPGSGLPSVKLKEDVLQLTLMLPQAATPGSAYRVELLANEKATKTFDTRAEETQSITVEIPAAQLTRGLYVGIVSTIDANGNPQRVPGIYPFKVE
jgi:anti-sigma-K factor RskA